MMWTDDPVIDEKRRQERIYELPECEEGILRWVPMDEVMDLPLWEGDRVFLPLLRGGGDCFSLKLNYAPGGELLDYHLETL